MWFTKTTKFQNEHDDEKLKHKDDFKAHMAEKMKISEQKKRQEIDQNRTLLWNPPLCSHVGNLYL